MQQTGLLAVALAEQPGVRIGRRGMIVDGPPLAMEARLALRLPPDGWSRSCLGRKLFEGAHARPSVP
jgi:hypothetical protein